MSISIVDTYSGPPAAGTFNAVTANVVAKASGSASVNTTSYDSSGNYYVCGKVNGNGNQIYNADGTPSTTALLAGSNTFDAAYIAKFDASGVALWAVTVDGAFSEQAFCVTVDSNNNVYLFSNTSNIATVRQPNSATPSSITIPTANVFGAVSIIKFDSDGNALWAAGYTISSIDSWSSYSKQYIRVDSNGNLYGLFRAGQTNTIDVYEAGSAAATTVTLTDISDTGMKTGIVKFSSTGAFVWATCVSGGLNTSINVAGLSVAVDSQNNVYLCGYASGQVLIVDATGQQTVTLPGEFDPNNGWGLGFLVKWSSMGIAEWAAKLDGIDGEYGYALAVTPDDGIVFGGATWTDTIQVHNSDGSIVTALNGLTLNGDPGTEINAIVKFNSAGLAQWASIVGLGAAGMHLAANPVTGQIAVAGDSWGSGNFYIKHTGYKTGGDPAFAYSYNNEGYGYAVVFSANGTAEAVFPFQGSYTGVSFGKANELTLNGTYTSSQTILNAGLQPSSVVLPTIGGTHGFVVRYEYVAGGVTYTLADQSVNGFQKLIINRTNDVLNVSKTVGTIEVAPLSKTLVVWYNDWI